ncbi:hypothetical protein GZ77_03570 [Endozoicomonas montiporae]|uniref:Uncharacterized protein n=2 Tax=Endozoicomonas montiporae TaxID=1027273 RepID=A0A081NB46_9GAMM|nr:hypothetical protein [Endozoicomonas montiporae]AMO56619.1 hypothetical protein EZMO1_2540 [Endozoicomonas montiporae CL-33]KEQ15669.1 hypothetical protein GZ77_03570 [Endozoicomonas montiporae]
MDNACLECDGEGGWFEGEYDDKEFVACDACAGSGEEIGQDEYEQFYSGLFDYGDVEGNGNAKDE